ncbi:sensor histidine kinase [Anopheles sinensis]|uniref:Sensor histidine kinase n=1 Tax=Anopheles sinensis TaxID=74873 RepID=A0A084WPM9_ANOSI|nr:sensor histidine kinase [Anopheles sinensis]
MKCQAAQAAWSHFSHTIKSPVPSASESGTLHYGNIQRIIGSRGREGEDMPESRRNVGPAARCYQQSKTFDACRLDLPDTGAGSCRVLNTRPATGGYRGLEDKRPVAQPSVSWKDS